MELIVTNLNNRNKVLSHSVLSEVKEGTSSYNKLNELLNKKEQEIARK